MYIPDDCATEPGAAPIATTDQRQLHSGADAPTAHRLTSSLGEPTDEYEFVLNSADDVGAHVGRYRLAPPVLPGSRTHARAVSGQILARAARRMWTRPL